MNKSDEFELGGNGKYFILHKEGKENDPKIRTVCSTLWFWVFRSP